LSQSERRKEIGRSKVQLSTRATVEHSNFIGWRPNFLLGVAPEASGHNGDIREPTREAAMVAFAN
jgi:hypothetical protein